MTYKTLTEAKASALNLHKADGKVWVVTDNLMVWTQEVVDKWFKVKGYKFPNKVVARAADGKITSYKS